MHVFACPSQVGYEFLFPIHSPLITRIQVLKRGFIGRNKNACAGIRLVPVQRHSLRHIAFTICIFCIFVLPICEKNVWKNRKFEKNICLWYTLHATNVTSSASRYFMRAMVGKRNVIPIDKVNGQLAENGMNFTYHHFMFKKKEWRVFKLWYLQTEIIYIYLYKMYFVDFIYIHYICTYLLIDLCFSHFVCFFFRNQERTEMDKTSLGTSRTGESCDVKTWKCGSCDFLREDMKLTWNELKILKTDFSCFVFDCFSHFLWLLHFAFCMIFFKISLQTFKLQILDPSFVFRLSTTCTNFVGAPSVSSVSYV